MHHVAFASMPKESTFAGQPMPSFTDGIPRVQKGPPFKLKDVNEAIIAKVAERYKLAQTRVDRLYKGEVRSVSGNDCSCC